MLKSYRLSFYTELGSYMGWIPWAHNYIDPEVINWIHSGNAIKFNGNMFTDIDALAASIKTELDWFRRLTLRGYLTKLISIGEYYHDQL